MTGTIATGEPAVMGCDVCGAPDVLALGACVTCGSPSADALLFVQRSTRRKDRRGVEAWLVEASRGVVRREDARDVAGGRRPVAGLPSPAAVRAVGALEARGIAATVVPRGRAWSRLPVGSVLLVGLVLGAGLFAGASASPWLAGLSVGFAGLLVHAASRRVREPVWAPRLEPVLGLPGDAEAGVRVTLARLEDGRARSFLRDLVAVSIPLVDAERGASDHEARAGVRELLELACGAAIDLDRLDASLAVLERREADDGSRDVVEAIERGARVRDAVIDRFEEALASLARLQAASVEAPRRLSELAGRLAEDKRRRADAWEEVRRLVG